MTRMRIADCGLRNGERGFSVLPILITQAWMVFFFPVAAVRAWMFVSGSPVPLVVCAVAAVLMAALVDRAIFKGGAR